jgi:L-ribulose-5-phosphate 4-epimerase
MMNETGSVKYACTWIMASPVDQDMVEGLNICRAELYRLGWIGVYPNHIGYGNISIRLDGNLFLITGTSTGHLGSLTHEHYTKVTGYNFAENRLTCQGPIKASAESLTHAAVYESDDDIQAVIHIHSKTLWDKLKDVVPTSSADVAYGTPQMALEIHRLFRETDVKSQRIIVMGGHEEGIISFGADLEEARRVIMGYV